MIVNGAMMNGIDALSMSLYDYTAAMHCWSAAHDADTPPEQITDEDARELEAEASAIDWDAMTAEAGHGNR